MTTVTIAIDRAHLDTILTGMQAEIVNADSLPELHMIHGRAVGALAVLAGLGIVPKEFAEAHMNAQAIAANARAIDLYKFLSQQSGLTFH